MKKVSQVIKKILSSTSVSNSDNKSSYYNDFWRFMWLWRLE